MNGRSASALLGLLTIAMMAFAGCINPADLMNAASQKTEITAMEDKDLADNAAKAWNPNAKLVSVFSIELGANPETGDIPLDQDVGNGKAPLWYYAYCVDNAASTEAASGEGYASDDGSRASSSSMQVRAFRVTADGRVKAENDTPMPAMPQGAPDMKDIAEWKVDSPKALDAARSNETFAAALGAPNASLAEGVAQMDGVTGWYFAAVSESGSAIAIVDASTGKLVSVREFNLDFGKIPAYAKHSMPAAMAVPLEVEGKGRVDNTKQKMEFPFTYDGGKTVASLKINGQGDLPTDGFTFVLVDSKDQPIKAEGSSNRGGNPMMMGGGSMVAKYALKEAGDYKLIVSYRAFPPTPSGPVPVGPGGETFDFKLSNAGDKAKEG